MALARLEITPLDAQGRKQPARRFNVRFNPESYSVAKTVAWRAAGSERDGLPTNRLLNAPALAFDGGQARTLSLSLFYDVTEPVNGRRVADVRTLTNRIAQLARIDRTLGHPPIVRIAWGHAPTGSDFPFTGVLTSLTQNFTLFAADGRPLRAELTASWTEFLSPEQDRRDTDPELTTRRVHRGDSLGAIAAEVYQDPRDWRRIAEANALDDPRRLDVGRTLSIPDPEGRT